MIRSTIVAVLGGGRGTRLYPLTKLRSKPAVPIGGKYRLIDVPISNCINSGLRSIYVLTQFNAGSLTRHISNTYKFDNFSHGFVDVLAAEQTLEHSDWFQGTADAVRKHLNRFLRHGHADILILAADHLYRMDFREMLQTHKDLDADVTLSVIPVSEKDASRFGLMQLTPEGTVCRFVEKPKDPSSLAPGYFIESDGDRLYLASMGIYVFKLAVLREILETGDEVDFGKEIIPKAIGRKRVVAHTFKGYWEDIGTIDAFHRANLSLAHLEPQFRLYSQDEPIFTHARFLPATVFDGCTIKQSMIADGCLILGKQIINSIIGVRSKVGIGTTIQDSYIMGADFYELREPTGPAIDDSIPRIGIGNKCHIRRAIIDKNARIGDNCTITNETGTETADGPGYAIRDGIVVVEKNAIIESGTTI